MQHPALRCRQLVPILKLRENLLCQCGGEKESSLCGCGVPAAELMPQGCRRRYRTDASELAAVCSSVPDSSSPALGVQFSHQPVRGKFDKVEVM